MNISAEEADAGAAEKEVAELDASTHRRFGEATTILEQDTSSEADHREAEKTIRDVANQGHAQAQSNLGVMYSNGRGVPQNHSTAVKWYQKAADQGHGQAQNSLGVMYMDGRGVPQNDSTAVK